jgi:hypothetical protein
MGRPTNRDELLAAAEHEYAQLMDAVDEVPKDLRSTPGACAEWSVKDLLAHLSAWHLMLLDWEHVGAAGRKPEMPAKGFTWRQTPELNDTIYHRYVDDSWEDVLDNLRRSHADVIEMIEGYDDEDLFTKQRYAWTGSTSVGAYATSATSSHYAWATKHVRRFVREH